MSVTLITRAASFAGQAHANQRRKATGEPYVNHLLRVADEVARANLSVEVIAAALLHDTVEDTPVTLNDLKANFPSRVCELVQLLSKWWPDTAADDTKAREKIKYYSQILADEDAIELKLCDRADNLWDMSLVAKSHRAWATTFFEKTEKEVTALFQRSQNPYVKSLYTKSRDALRDALDC